MDFATNALCQDVAVLEVLEVAGDVAVLEVAGVLCAILPPIYPACTQNCGHLWILPQTPTLGLLLFWRLLGMLLKID